MQSADTIAWLATLCVGGSYLFQVRKAYISKHLDDVSWLFLLIITLGNLLWIYYGVLRGDTTFIITNVVIALFVLVLIAMKLHYRNRSR